MLLKGQVVNLRLHSNATYEYSYSVGARNVSAWCGLYACVYVVACVYNCGIVRELCCVTHAEPHVMIMLLRSLYPLAYQHVA